MSLCRPMVLMLLAVLMMAPVASQASQQPPPDAKQGYVPVDTVEEQLPAAPLVIGAYAVVWVALALYLWSIWLRLSRVEHELARVSRRIEAGGMRR
jgi:CcmD family protein